MITVYGIPNCETVKKARAWLSSHGLAYQFHDFKKLGVPTDRLDAWAQAVGADKLVNRQGTTWRKLGSDMQARAAEWDDAKTLVTENASLIRRPVVEWMQGAGLISAVTIGFDAAHWESISTQFKS